ncbi:MAG: BMP family lipoprotein, partial [Desulfovibrionaceae bacterium]
FAQNEASYLAGTLAAIMSKTGAIGFLGAVKNKDIEDFLAGYQAGARQARKRIRIETAWLEEAAQDLSPFAAPDAARKAALAMYAKGCDIIFAVAAGSNIGVFEAARKTGNFAIGVDQDQDHMAPGYVLTSVVKRLDLAVFTMLRDILANRFQNKIHVMDLDSGAVGLSPMRYTKVLVPDETLRTLEQLKQAINAGRIHVPTADPVYRFSRRPQ